MTKLILAMSWIVGYAYFVEFFIAWYSGNPYESFVFNNRALGPFGWAFAIMVTCNVVVPQIFWLKKARTSMTVLFVASIIVNVGMWFERFVIVVTSLHRDFLPSSWGVFARFGTSPRLREVSASFSPCSACSCDSCPWWRSPRSKVA